MHSVHVGAICDNALVSHWTRSNHEVMPLDSNSVHAVQCTTQNTDHQTTRVCSSN